MTLSPLPERYLRGREFLLPKKSIDVFTNPNTDRLLEWLDPDEIVVFGVATDVCDDAAIRGFLDRGGRCASSRTRPAGSTRARGDVHERLARRRRRVHYRGAGDFEPVG
jgi:nicotinamidase-related amidase